MCTLLMGVGTLVYYWHLNTHNIIHAEIHANIPIISVYMSMPYIIIRKTHYILQSSQRNLPEHYRKGAKFGTPG